METMMSENPYFRTTLDTAGPASSLTLEERAILAARASLFLQGQRPPITSSPPATTTSSSMSLSAFSPSSTLSHIYSLGNRTSSVPASGSTPTPTPGSQGGPFSLPLHLWSQWAALQGIILAPHTPPSSPGIGDTGGVRLPRPVYPTPPAPGIHHRFAPYFYPKTSPTSTIQRPGSPESSRPPPDSSPGGHT